MSLCFYFLVLHASTAQNVPSCCTNRVYRAIQKSSDIRITAPYDDDVQTLERTQ